MMDERKILSETLWELYDYLGALKDDAVKLQKHLEQMQRYIDDVENSYSLEQYRDKKEKER